MSEAELSARPNPHIGWIVEYGAIALPFGDPSRVTVLTIFQDEHDAASALYEAGKEFAAQMYPVKLQLPGGIA